MVYIYLCNQFLSPLTLCVRIKLRRGVLDTTLCDKFIRVHRFPPPKNSYLRDITEILMKVALNTITLTLTPYLIYLNTIKQTNKETEQWSTTNLFYLLRIEIMFVFICSKFIVHVFREYVIPASYVPLLLNIACACFSS